MKKIASMFLLFCAGVMCLGADSLSRIGGFTGGGPHPQVVQTNMAVLSRDRAAMRRETLRRMEVLRLAQPAPVLIPKPITQRESLHGRIVRVIPEGLLLEKATETRIGSPTGEYDAGYTTRKFTGRGQMILLVRYPEKDPLAGKIIDVLAMRSGSHELSEGFRIARYDYGRPVNLERSR